MALQLLDGSNGNIVVTINSLPFTCVINRWSADIVREFTEKTTFCSAGWRSRDPGMKQLVGRIDGYLSKGIAGSDPLALIAADTVTGLPFTLQADTGCFLSGTCHIGLYHAGSNAQLNSEMSIGFESDGAVTSTWIVV
jgi:hypothetical protein